MLKGSATRAVIFDFNGTLADDEPILLQIFTELFAEHLGWRMSADDYYDRLAGLGDREIIEIAVTEHLGPVEQHRHQVADLLRLRSDRYLELVEKECPVTSATQDLVRAVVEAGCQVAIVTGAQRADVERVLACSGLAAHFAVVVTEEDVASGKPDPEGFLRALRLLGLAPEEVLVFEDSVAGIRAATAARTRAVAVAGTHSRAALEAEGVPIVEALTAALAALL